MGICFWEFPVSGAILVYARLFGHVNQMPPETAQQKQVKLNPNLGYPNSGYRFLT
jgi:hypothetical protein